MAPFDTGSYWRLIVITALSCIISETKAILVENRDYFVPHLHSTPLFGVTVGGAVA